MPSADATKTRWPQDLVWTKVHKAIFGGTPLDRTVRVAETMSLERAKVGLIGLAATAGAYFETADYMDALQRLSFTVEAHIMEAKIDFAVKVAEKRARILSGTD